MPNANRGAVGFQSSEFEQEYDRPSKSQLKREMTALQKLGAELVGEARDRIKRIAMPEDVREAILTCQDITDHEGRRRQIQYVGKLMRHVDAESIRAQLDVDSGQHRAETAVMHAAERWRDVLVASPDRLAEFVERYPAAANRNLHAMLRSARAEVARQQHGRHFRELFRELRDLLLAELAPPPAPTERPDA